MCEDSCARAWRPVTAWRSKSGAGGFAQGKPPPTFGGLGPGRPNVFDRSLPGNETAAQPTLA